MFLEEQEQQELQKGVFRGEWACANNLSLDQYLSWRAIPQRTRQNTLGIGRFRLTGSSHHRRYRCVRIRRLHDLCQSRVLSARTKWACVYSGRPVRLQFRWQLPQELSASKEKRRPLWGPATNQKYLDSKNRRQDRLSDWVPSHQRKESKHRALQSQSRCNSQQSLLYKLHHQWGACIVAVEVSP